MGNWNTLYPDNDSLRTVLEKIRSAGQYTNRGSDWKPRIEHAVPLLSAIVGEEREWTDDQCEFFFEELLRKYCEADKLDLLLAVSGYGDEYCNRKTATNRREHYFELVVEPEVHNGTSAITEADSLRKVEIAALEVIADKMQEDYVSGKLRSFVYDLFREDLEMMLELDDDSDDEATALSDAPMSENITYNLFYADGDGEGEYWGDSDGGRHAYTKKEVNSGFLEHLIVFNSITDGEYGDERNFVGAALVSGEESIWYGDRIKVEDGKTYVICLYIRNDNPDGLKAIAEDVRVRISLPTTISKSHVITGYIDSSNAKPGRYWDSVALYSDEEFYIKYKEDSAQYMNSAMGSIPLTDDSIVRGGTPLGYDRFDGKLPGGYGYEGIVTIKVTVHSALSTYLSVNARLKGTSQWRERVFANIGDEVEFQIEYRNLFADTVEDVMIRDILPTNMAYVKGSTVLYDSVNQEGFALDDAHSIVVGSGINIGNYGPRGNAYVRFTAKVVDNALIRGTTQLVNWANATVSGEVTKDDVSIMVVKQ